MYSLKNTRKGFSLLFLCVAVLFFSSARPALAEEKIKSYETVISAEADASLQVRETIRYDFGDAQKHGIFRDIHLKQTYDNKTKRIKISNVKVSDEFGAPYQFVTTLSRDNLNIKIGNPNVLVSSSKTYVIEYIVSGAVSYFDDHDEVYWNAIGPNWPVSIEQSSAEVILPKVVSASDIKKECFAGYLKNVAHCLGSEIEEGSTPGSAVLFSQGNLVPREGFTVVVGFPKGLVLEPTRLQSFVALLEDNLSAYALPIVILIVLLCLWYTYGRDAGGRGVITPQYDVPDELSPAEVGLIVREKTDNGDISAEIIQFAVSGYLSIRRIEEKHFLRTSVDYALKKLKDETDLPEGFRKEIFAYLFKFMDPSTKEVLISQFKSAPDKTFIRNIHSNIAKAVTDKGYFKRNPTKIKNWYMAAAFLLAFLLVFAAGAFISLFSVSGFMGFVVIALLIVLFGRFMPARSAKGAITREYILGLKDYLTVAEKDRIKFHNAPGKNPERFEKLLPYAMVLGVEKEWAKQFDGIYEQMPNWYSDPSGHAFNSTFFVASLNSFSSFTSSTFSISSGGSSSGFGGGGFSGGGGGGCGGGSW